MALYALLPMLFAVGIGRLTDRIGAPAAAARDLAGPLTRRELRRLSIASGLLASAGDTFTFAPPIYGSAIGLSAWSIGLAPGAFSGATFVIRVLLPAISRRLAPWP